jgi:hypothetical protein
MFPQNAHRGDAQSDKNKKDEALRDGEGRFRLSRRQFLEGGRLLEELGHQDEKIEYKAARAVTT